MVAWGYGAYGHGAAYGSTTYGGCIGGLTFTTNGKRLTNSAAGAGCYGMMGGYGAYGGVGIWDRATAKEIPPPKESSRVLAVSRDGTRLAMAGGGTKTEFKQVQREVVDKGPDGKEHKKTVTEMVPETVMTPLAVRVWDVESDKEISRFKDVGEPITGASFSPDDKELVTVTMRWNPQTGQQHGEVKLWNADPGRLLLTYQGASGTVAFSPDSTRLAVANLIPPPLPQPMPAPPVKKAALPRGRGLLDILLLLQPPPAEAIAVPKPRPLPPPKPPEVKVWDTANGQEVFTFKKLKAPVGGLHFSPDSRTLLTLGGELKVWSLKTGKAVFTHADASATLGFSPDGTRLAVASGGRAPLEGPRPPMAEEVPAGNAPAPGAVPAVPPPVIKLVDLHTGRVLVTLGGHTGAIRWIAFSPDGRQMASTGGEVGKLGEVKVWETLTGREVFTFLGHAGPVNVVVFRPDGQRLASGGEDGLVKIWTIRLPEPAAAARNP
jgi:WD40 repeat protein